MPDARTESIVAVLERYRQRADHALYGDDEELMSALMFTADDVPRLIWALEIFIARADACLLCLPAVELARQALAEKVDAHSQALRLMELPDA